MIRLTDKEMKALRPDIPACEQTVFGCDSCSGGCPIVAKAQLKKYSKFLLGEDNLLTTQGRRVIIRLTKELKV